MAAKKTANKKKARRGYYVRTVSAEERKWRLWVHDVDTLLHEMVKNPAHNETPPARAEAFADAYHAMQDRRRPASLEEDD
jgi:hypothetical protein